MMDEIINSFENLKSWINQNGGYVNDKLSLVPTADNRLSIVCNTNLENEKLFLINKRLILNLENSDLKLELGDMDFRNKLTLALLYEIKNPNTRFTNYFKLLPSLDRYREHPIFLFSENKFPRFSEKIYIRAQEIYQRFINLLNFCKSSNDDFLKTVTQEELFWSYLTVITRYIDGVGLVHLFDNFQHSNDSNTRFILEIDNIQLSLDGVYSIGEIVYTNQNYKDDIDFFLHRGALEKSEVCHLRAQFNFKDKPDVIKNIINSSKLTSDLHYSSLGLSNTLLYYLRTNMLSELDLILMSKDYNFYEQLITLENERKCLQKIKVNLSMLNSKEELEYVKVNLSTFEQNSLEYNICQIITKIDRMSNTLNNFIDSYWISLL